MATKLLCTTLPLLMIFGCVPAEYGRLAQMGFTGSARDWRIINASRTVLDDDLIAAGEDLRRIRTRELHLHGQPLTDQVIPTMLKIESLERINLSGTDITLDGVERLATLPRLAYLWVPASMEQDLARLRLQHPRVTFDLSELGQWYYQRRGFKNGH